MDFGICIPHYGKALEIGRILDIAKRAETLGFDSVWVTDHILVPQSMNIIYRDHMLEPLALLSHLAAVVTRVRLGTSVIILPYRSPIVVAKMLATIDQLSQGRVIMGTGAGWMEEEFAALHAPFKERGDFSDECLRIIRDIWTHDTVSIQGKFHHYDHMQTSPQPVQAGGPPIWVGGNSARSRRRVAELGDGWHASSLLASEMAPGCEHVRKLWAQNNRQGEPVFSARIGLSLDGVSEEVTAYASRRPRSSITGSITAAVEQFGAYRELGLEHVVLETSTQSHDGTLATMEAFVERIRPHL
jgi:probable F420-dependent oxidoreductase